MPEPNEKDIKRAKRWATNPMRHHLIPSDLVAELRAEKEAAVQKERDKVQSAYAECKEIAKGHVVKKPEGEAYQIHCVQNTHCNQIVREIQEAADKAKGEG